MTQTLLKMRTSNRILVSFTEDLHITHSLTRKQLDKSPKLKFKSPKKVEDIINKKIVDVTTAENIDISKTSCSSSDSYVASSSSSLIDSQEVEKSPKIILPVELPIKRNIFLERFKPPPVPIVVEEESFRSWALNEREKRNQILQQASFQQSKQERELNEVFPRVKQKRRSIVRNINTKDEDSIPGYLYGPYTKQLEFDHAMKKQTKFGVPLSMFTRAQQEAEIKNMCRRKLQISRLEYMKIPTIPSDSEEEDDTTEFAKHLSLVRTPFQTIVPKVTTKKISRSEKMRTKFLTGNRLKRVGILLYDRSVPYMRSETDDTPKTDGTKTSSRGSKSGSLTSRRGSVSSRRDSLTSRRGSDLMSGEGLPESGEEEDEDNFEDLSPYRRKYREFLNSKFKEKLQNYNDKLNQRLISFEKFRESERTSSTTTAKPSILDRKSLREFSTETASINVSITTPDPAFQKVKRTVKKNVRLSGFDNETGPFYIDPFLLEKNHNPEKG